MKKLFYLLFVVLLSLTSCDTGGGGGSTAGIPKHVAITDADGLFIASGSSPAGMPGRPMRASGEESLLMKAVGSETYEATFTDAQGQEVTVTVNYSRKLGSDYLYINYSHEGETYYAVASYSSGLLREIKRPDDQTKLREYQGSLYYISDNVLYKLALDSLDYTARSAGGDGLNSSAYVFVSPSTDNVFTFSQNDYRCYISGGTSYQDNSGNSSCMLFYMTFSGGNDRRFVVEDRDTAEIYFVEFLTTGVYAQRMEFDKPGYLYSVQPGDRFTISTTVIVETAERVGDNTVYFDNSAFVTNAGTEQIMRLARVGTENISIDFYTSSAEVMSYGDPAECKYDAASGKLILDYAFFGGVYKINCRDISGGATVESTLVETSDAISGCCITGGNVYYNAAGSLYGYNFDADSSSLVEIPAGEIEAVTE